MITRILLSAACCTTFALICFGTPTVYPPTMDNGDGSFQLAINYNSDNEIRFVSHGNLVEPLGLIFNQIQPVTLICPVAKAGQPITFSPLDGGGEVIVAGPLSVANDGTVAVSLKAAARPGLYRILVTVGADQYQLQLYVHKLVDGPGGGPASTPPPT
jgi:hypothetical protein